MHTVVFINSHSRRARRYLPTIQKFFATHKQFAVVDTIVVEDLSTFDDAIAQLQSHKKIECVMVCGGDGTVLAIVNALKHRTGITYGFLPLGTTNVYARNMGLPLSLKKALRVVAQQNVHDVSLGSVNGTFFFNTADIGLSVHVIKQLDYRLKRFFGPLSYYLTGALLLLLGRVKPIQCEIHYDNQDLHLETYDLAVINGAYYGPLPVTKTRSIYDDKLTIVFFTNKHRIGFLKDVTGFFVGQQHRHSNVSLVSASSITIKTKRPQSVQADGEVIGETPAEIKIIKNAIRVLVPPGK